MMADDNHVPQATSSTLEQDSPVGEEAVSEKLRADETDDIRKSLRDAEELKLEGNEYFRAGKWDEALVAYGSGLGRLPKRKETKPNGRDFEKGFEDGEEDGSRTERDDESNHKNEDAEELPPSDLDIECSKARAVMNANIGACYVKLGDHKEAAKTCTEALLDDPQYIKALQRRAASNEMINSWSSLTSAQEDYNALLKLLPPSSSQFNEARRSLERIIPRAEAAQKAEMGDMMDKLKGLGNNILGNFGLSTDNFKFEPNGQGGYSMNFVR